MPRSYLSGIFGASPVRPMEEHMDMVYKCVQKLLPFVDAVLDNDQALRDQYLQEIIQLEQEADEVKKDLRLHLPYSLFMPMSRRDLLEVLTMQDKVAGRTRDLAGLIAGRNMVIPDELKTDFKALVQRSVDAVEQACKAINELDELVETGFGPKVVELVESMLDNLDAIEQNTDQKLSDLYQILQAIESDMAPVDAIFLYRVLDWVGNIADRAQKVGSRLQLMLAR